jgi:DNA-binding transcriptional MerR regulator
VRIKKAADQLGLPVPTLRRWTQEFAAGLSPEARANEGRPREFSARDMRVLRRAKDILDRTRNPDTTYEQARRTLAGEGLLSHDAEVGENGAAAPAARNDAADREAAERFVREVVAREMGTLREANGQLVARVTDLERQLRQLRDDLAAALEPESTADGGRRKGWFR